MNCNRHDPFKHIKYTLPRRSQKRKRLKRVHGTATSASLLKVKATERDRNATRRSPKRHVWAPESCKFILYHHFFMLPLNESMLSRILQEQNKPTSWEGSTTCTTASQKPPESVAWGGASAYSIAPKSSFRNQEKIQPPARRLPLVVSRQR